MTSLDDSILNSTKKILGLDESYTAFDMDVLTHINTAFSALFDLGVGPLMEFEIEDAEAKWSDFLTGNSANNSIRTYVYLRVKMLFDPPATSYLIEATNKQIEKMEWLLNVRREGFEWVDPDPFESVVDNGDGTFTISDGDTA